MPSLTAARLGWWVCAVALLTWVLQLSLWGADGFVSDMPGADLQASWSGSFARVGYALTLGSTSVIGALVIARQPRNPVGWILSTAGLMVALDIFAGVYATSSVLALPGARPPAATAVAWAGNLLESNWALVVPLLLLFPDGRLPSSRWRPLLWLAGVATAMFVFGLAFMPGPLSGLQLIDNPVGLAGYGEPVALVSRLALLGLVGATVLSAVGLVLRFHRARGDERQQLKWVVSAVVVWVFALIAVVLAPQAWQPVREIVYVLALGGFVAAFGLAILKYRLYDIDVVISRTLVYGVLAVSIGLVYVGVVAGLGVVLGTRGDPNLALSLVATAAVAVIFQPLRERLQRWASRLVYGERATPYGVLAGFSRRIGGALSLDEVLPRVAEAVAHGVGAARSRVRVYVPGGVDHAVAWPVEALAADLEQTALVLHRGEAVGEISVSKLPGEVLTPSERTLLDDLAAQAGPAFSNVRLTEELRASRQRIVAAQDAERRRIERDLHDGAQQHLVAISVNLRVVQELIEADVAAARELLVEVQGQATEALATMRDLARGIYPPALADRGIAAALEAHLAKSRQGATLEVDPVVADGRFAPAAEAAVYFCVLEALQNCSKHAPEATVRVRLHMESETLVFGVTDDGTGFEESRTNGGTGLQGMADRIAAVGGSLRVDSVPGQGTSIVGKLPLST